MLLADVMHSVHCNTVMSHSVSELWVKMPSSIHSFRTIYNLLAHGNTLPSDVKSPEDGLLLLTAFLSDIVYVQRCHISLSPISTPKDEKLHNPYAPLSAKSEFMRQSSDMMAALSQWEDTFHDKVENDILALYYFTKLHLTCTGLWELPRMAGYGNLGSHQIESREMQISDNAMDLAWLVLDHCDKSSKSSRPKLSIWLPIVLFISALVVWQRLRSRAAADLKYGTLKVLSMFKHEIARLPWPCCREMSKTLENLMQN